MIHSPSWWNDLETDTVLQKWLANASFYAKIALKDALQHPTDSTKTFRSSQSLIQLWSQLPDEQWNQLNQSFQEIRQYEDSIQNHLFSSVSPIWNQHIFYSMPLLERLNSSVWAHQPWTLLTLYAQPASTFLIPILIIIIPLLFCTWKGIPFPWAFLRQQMMAFVSYAWGADLFLYRNQYHWATLGFLLVKRWVSVGIYLYGIWSSLRHSIEIQGYATNILNEFKNLREWFNKITNFVSLLPQADQYHQEMNEKQKWINYNFSLNYDYSHFWYPTRWLIPGRCWKDWNHWEKVRKSFEPVMTTIGKVLAMFHLARLVREQTSPIGFPTWNVSKRIYWKGGYHPGFLGEQPKYQSYQYRKNRRFWLIMGANASGKTTFLKTASWIHWMAQAWGIVPCKKANLQWIYHFWSWVRVPDATGRESLFEAEVRRAKEIMESLSQTGKETAWVWMDEVFGSTNARESTACAYATLKTCLEDYPNLYGGCTTHLHGLVKLRRMPEIHLMHFEMKREGEKWIPTYQYRSGGKAQELALEWVKQKGDMPQRWIDVATNGCV